MSGRSRWVLGAVAVLALGALILNLRWLAASAYAAYGAELGRSAPHAATAQAATAIAVTLAPWEAKAQADHAWQLARAGDFSAARERMLRALRATPADAFLWQDYAQLLASHWDFGQDTTQALRQASRLAPNSPALLSHNAELGIRHWSNGSAEQHAIWLKGMQHVLAARRADFLNSLAVQDAATPVCLMVAAELGLEDWCARYGQALDACQSTSATSADTTACVLQRVKA